MLKLDSVTLTLSQPTCRKGWSQVTLRPGVIDDQALEMFGFSQCLLLACALHEETGWSMLGFETRCPSGCWCWRHLGVQTPCGRFLDIQGVRICAEVQREASVLMADHPARMVELPTLADLRRWTQPSSVTSDSWWKRDWVLTRGDFVSDVLGPFVSTLVDTYQAQVDVAA